MECNLIVVLTFIFLMANEVEHLSHSFFPYFLRFKYFKNFCSTLCWFLPYSSASQPRLCSRLRPDLWPPHPPGRHGAQTGLLMQQLLTCPCLPGGAGATTLSSGPTLSLAHCVHKSVLYVCVSMSSLQTGSSGFFCILYACFNAYFTCCFASVYSAMSGHIFCPLSNWT